MDLKFLKKLSRFERDGKKISRILETNFPVGSQNHLPFWDGVHTVTPQKNSVLLSDRIDELRLNKDNVAKGYIAAENARVIHFLSPKKKLVKRITYSFYHAIADDLAEIVYALEVCPDAELILDVTDIRKDLHEHTWDFVGFFLKCLDDKKVKYTLVELSKFDVMYINNFALLSFPFHSGARLDMLSDFFSKYVTDKKQKAYRKVYVSRKKNGYHPENKDAQNFSYTNDNRIDSHEKIEQIFFDMGFDIIYPEDFNTFQEQLDFFYSVKTLACLTSSGIVNGVFMQPQGNIIEVVTPLLTKSPVITDEYLIANNLDPKDYGVNLQTVQEIHMFYHNLAFFKNHTYIGIPNYTRDSDKIKQFIENNTLLKEMLESNE